MHAPFPFVAWTHTVETDGAHLIVPDGCCDLLLLDRGSARPDVHQTEIDLAPRYVWLPKGLRITGFRLRPGAQLAPDLRKEIAARPEAAGALLATLAPDPDLLDAIACLEQPGVTVAQAAATLGISQRTLQRFFDRRHLPSPEYWRGLARARRAANALRGPQSLADIALDAGFADQAHMTRAFSRWFATSPARLRREPDRLTQMAQPALASWTGEQSSTR